VVAATGAIGATTDLAPASWPTAELGAGDGLSEGQADKKKRSDRHAKWRIEASYDRPMKRAVSLLWVALVACGASPAYEAESPEAPPPSAPQTPPPPPGAAPPGSTPADPAQMQASDGTADPPSWAELEPDAAAPPPDQWSVSYPSGQWVYANGYGWMWIPNEPNEVIVEETPYVYLYTPAYGWTWYVSPWGPGRYRYGVWVVHPWRPMGWRYGWVARRGVVVHIHGHAHMRGAPRGGRGRRH
jgi:hypothetical protein